MTKITVIHGQLHKGSTYNITKQIISKVSNKDKEVHEYFMPKDTPDFCIGCYKCFDKGEEYCPQAEKVGKIIGSMVKSDVIIINSPTYCYGMTGQLKTLFDHFGYMWISHRPKEAMFRKMGVVISTATGAGSKKVTKSLSQQLFWLGVPKVFRYNKNVNASNWEDVPDKIKESIEKDTSILAKKIEGKLGKVRVGLKLKSTFNIMRMIQKSNNWNMVDKNYWQENGWLDKRRPW
ncbi:MAG TPA: NAD(P)H-dependent oxidoreductase [Thermoanaerobacterales bacterium]|nr:NAD(P)H-dependent oxidoreductase [Thermoanaerobacterales bacterium]